MNKIALVTGAGSGIGKEVTLALAQNGYEMILAGRDLTKLQNVQTMIESTAHQTALSVATNVSDPQSVAKLFKTIKEKYGRIDVLFNNAGISIKGKDIDQVTPEDWLKVVGTNLNGMFFCAQQAFALMKTQNPMGGRIINNGSISAYSPRPQSITYAASKHGVSGLTKSLALDGRNYQIACGQIDIGNAATDMTEAQRQGIKQANGQMAIEDNMDVKDVARAVIFMASLPLSANVLNMTIMATNMPFVGRG